MQDQPVVRDYARTELDLRRGEIATELPHDLFISGDRDLSLVLTQRSEPRTARAREVAGSERSTSTSKNGSKPSTISAR